MTRYDRVMGKWALLVLFLCPAAAGTGEPQPAQPNLAPCLETLCPTAQTPWDRRELLGEAMGRWLGVHDGRWDAFDEKLFEDSDLSPAISGTIRKNAAVILLRWHPGE